jgi:hypothetical protein
MKKYTIKELGIIKSSLHLSDLEIANLLGVTERNLKNARKRHGILRPKSEWFFPKGNTPWNKGKRYNPGGKSAETRFKKGHVPVTAFRNMGDVFERPDSDGRMQMFIKLPENSQYPYGRYVWQQQTREVLGKNDVIRFKDGNPLNCEFSNLHKVTRAENMTLNQNREKGAESLRKTWAAVKTFEDFGIESTVYKFRSKRKVS